MTSTNAHKGDITIVGLTGSIGAGKTLIAELLIAQRVPVCNADAVDKIVLMQDAEVKDAIAERYPDVVSDGAVAPHKLAEHIFKDPEAVQWIEGILHPKILTYMVDWTAKLVGRFPIVFWEVPLLFEAEWDEYTDYSLLVAAPKAIRKKRAMMRPYMTDEQFEQITELQMPEAEKMKRADHIIYNHANTAWAYHQLGRMLEKIGS